MDPKAPTQPNPSNPAPSGDPNGGKPGEGTTPPATPPAGDPKPAEGAFDPKTATPEQLAAVLDNPNFWKLERIQRLNSDAGEAKKLKDAAAKAEEQKLEADKKFEELAQKRGTELEQAQKTIQDLRTNQELQSKLAPLGVVDLDGALKLIDRSKITVGEDGSVSGVDEAIEALKTEKAYLFNATPGKPQVGSPTNPGNGGGSGEPPKFKASQLRGPEGAKFYQEHKEEILKAQAEGRIEQD